MIVYEAIEQGSSAWAECRKGIPSASNADKIITPAKGELSKQAWDYGCQLLAETMLPAHYWISDSFASEAMQHGTNTEREARDYFALERSVDVREVGFCLTDDRRFGCSPDGLIGDSEGLELKCPTHKTQVKYLLNKKLPDEYKPQVHWSLIVTGYPVWWFLSYAQGLPPLLLRVEPDDYTDKVRDAMEKFADMFAHMKAQLGNMLIPVPSLDQATNPF